MAMSMGMVLKNIRWNRGIRFLQSRQRAFIGSWCLLNVGLLGHSSSQQPPATLRLARTRIRFSVGCV